MNIDSIMSKTIITKDLTTPIWEVSRIMDEANIGFIPITHNKKIIGVITDRDICVRCCKENNSLQKPINDFITKNIVTVDISDNVAHVLRVMAENRVKRVLVKDDNIIGVLSLSDIINHYSAISELIPTLQAIWTIDKSNQNSNSEIDSFEL